ncbi:hypothetical protein Egran_05696, partial [Elaphomyces granulatus]
MLLSVTIRILNAVLKGFYFVYLVDQLTGRLRASHTSLPQRLKPNC